MLYFTVAYDSITRTGVIGRYQRMADQITKLAKPVVFSLCEWGWSQVWVWGKQLGQSWRVSTDSTSDHPSPRI